VLVQYCTVLLLLRYRRFSCWHSYPILWYCVVLVLPGTCTVLWYCTFLNSCTVQYCTPTLVVLVLHGSCSWTWCTVLVPVQMLVLYSTQSLKKNKCSVCSFFLLHISGTALSGRSATVSSLSIFSLFWCSQVLVVLLIYPVPLLLCRVVVLLYWLVLVEQAFHVFSVVPYCFNIYCIYPILLSAMYPWFSTRCYLYWWYAIFISGCCVLYCTTKFSTRTSPFCFQIVWLYSYEFLCTFSTKSLFFLVDTFCFSTCTILFVLDVHDLLDYELVFCCMVLLAVI
jgi:hypothetical protein